MWLVPLQFEPWFFNNNNRINRGEWQICLNRFPQQICLLFFTHFRCKNRSSSRFIVRSRFLYNVMSPSFVAVVAVVAFCRTTCQSVAGQTPNEDIIHVIQKLDQKVTRMEQRMEMRMSSMEEQILSLVQRIDRYHPHNNNHSTTSNNTGNNNSTGTNNNNNNIRSGSRLGLLSTQHKGTSSSKMVQRCEITFCWILWFPLFFAAVGTISDRLDGRMYQLLWVVAGTGVHLCTEEELVRAQRIIKKFTHFTLNCNTCFFEGCVFFAIFYGKFRWNVELENGFVFGNDCFFNVNLFFLGLSCFFFLGVNILSETAYTGLWRVKKFIMRRAASQSRVYILPISYRHPVIILNFGVEICSTNQLDAWGIFHPRENHLIHTRLNFKINFAFMCTV